MQSTRDRVQNHRAKFRKAGLKPVQIWVPDVKAPGFVEECRRQSQIAADDPHNLEDLEAFAEIADWSEE